MTTMSRRAISRPCVGVTYPLEVRRADPLTMRTCSLLNPWTYTFSVEAQAGATPNNGYQGKGTLTRAVFPG